MFNEQLAVLLLVMANQVPSHAIAPTATAQQQVSVERSSLKLKLDPRIAAPMARLPRASQRHAIQTAGLFASN